MTSIPNFENQFWALNPREKSTNSVDLLLNQVHLQREQARKYLYLFIPQDLASACRQFNFPFDRIRDAFQVLDQDYVQPCFILSYFYFETTWKALALTFIPKSLDTANLRGIDPEKLKPIKGVKGVINLKSAQMSELIRRLGPQFQLIPSEQLITLSSIQNIKAFFLSPDLYPNGLLISCFSEQLEIEFEHHSRKKEDIVNASKQRITREDLLWALKSLFDGCLRAMVDLSPPPEYGVQSSQEKMTLPTTW